MKKSEAQGMQTFDTALYKLYKEGRISLEDALKNADSKNNLRLQISLSDKNKGEPAPKAPTAGTTDTQQPKQPASPSPTAPPGGLSLSLEPMANEEPDEEEENSDLAPVTPRFGKRP